MEMLSTFHTRADYKTHTHTHTHMNRLQKYTKNAIQTIKVKT